MPKCLTRGQKAWGCSLGLLCTGQKLKQQQLSPRTWLLLLHPLPQGCSIPLQEATVAPTAAGRRKSAAQLLLCLSVLTCTVSLVLLFPVLSSDLVETSGKTPRSHRVMGICCCERTAASLSRCCVWKEEGGQLEASSSSVCCQQCLLLWESSILAGFPGSRACTAGPHWGGSLSPGIVTFPM